MVEMQYQRLKPGALVTAAAVAYLTSLRVPQLILCKQGLIEVLEIDDKESSTVSSVELNWPVLTCSVLTASRSMREFKDMLPLNCHEQLRCLDLLIVTDGEGRLGVIQWNEKELELKPYILPYEIKGNLVKSVAMLKQPVVSWPIRFFDSSGKQNNCKSKFHGSTYIAISSYQEVIQVVLASWKIPDDTQKLRSLLSPDQMSCIVQDLQIHYFQMFDIESDGLGSLVPPPQALDVLGLCFLGSQTINDDTFSMEAKDCKGRPLLALLTAHKGFTQNMISLVCVVVDFSTTKISAGPWKVSNLHPTTRLLVPWTSQNEDESFRMAAFSTHLGILTISSIRISFFQAQGCTSFLNLALKGIPTCCDIIDRTNLVVGDSSASLYLFDLSDCQCFRMQRIISNDCFSAVKVLKYITVMRAVSDHRFIFYAYCEGGDAHVFAITKETEYKENSSESACGSPKCVHAVSILNGENEVEKRDAAQSLTFDTTAPIHDSLLIHNPGCESERHLLLACGNFPYGSLQRGKMAVNLLLDGAYDVQIRDLPVLIPFKRHSRVYHSHIVLSHRIEDASQIMEITGSGFMSACIHGFDTGHRTLIMGTLLDRWLVQVTSVSLRILQICSCGALVNEWMPDESFPEMKKQSITLAVLNDETIVLAFVKTIYAITVTDKGLPQITGSRSYPYEVSSLEICSLQLPSYLKKYDTEVTSAISVVVFGQWSSNTVSILRLPDLEVLATVDCDSAAPVRSSNLVELQGTHYLFVGMANGNLLYFTLQIFQYTDTDQGQGKMNDDELQLNDSAREKETCTHFQSSKSAFSLKREFSFTNNMNKFSLRILNKSCLRVGCSEVSFLVGNVFGMHNSSFMSKSVLIQTAENAVLLVKNNHELKAYGVYGATSLMTSTARIHTEAYPHSLISISKSGQLLIFHLADLPNLCWDKLHLGGTPSHLVYHEQSQCAVVSCLEIQSAKVVFVHIKSMCKVLCLEVGGLYRPSFMGTVDLPCLENIGVLKQYLLLGSCDNAVGTLAILDFQNFSPGNQQMQYELHLLASRETEIPFHCFCVLSAAEHGSQSTILNRKELFAF